MDYQALASVDVTVDALEQEQPKASAASRQILLASDDPVAVAEITVALDVDHQDFVVKRVTQANDLQRVCQNQPVDCVVLADSLCSTNRLDFIDQFRLECGLLALPVLLLAEHNPNNELIGTSGSGAIAVHNLEVNGTNGLVDRLDRLLWLVEMEKTITNNYLHSELVNYNGNYGLQDLLNVVLRVIEVDIGRDKIDLELDAKLSALGCDPWSFCQMLVQAISFGSRYVGVGGKIRLTTLAFASDKQPLFNVELASTQGAEPVSFDWPAHPIKQ